MGCGASVSLDYAAAGGIGAAAATPGSTATLASQSHVQLAVDSGEQLGASEAAPEEEEDWSWRKVVLDRYEVRGTDVLGVGNFSVVRRGRDITQGTSVAVKSLKHASDAKFRREVFLFRELLSAPPAAECGPSGSAAAPRAEEMFVRLLGHSPLDALAQGLERFCVLELGSFNLQELVVHCHDLASAGKPHSLSAPAELRRTFFHIIRALAFLHCRNFVHGDLKPANVMWFGDARGGAWKLIDLDGLLTFSQLVDMRDADFYTPIYAAPEVAAAVSSGSPLRVLPTLDVWAAGVTVLEMEALRPPLFHRFEELCTNSDDGLAMFMRWLAETPSPVPVPASARAASPELLEVLRESVLVAEPARRSTPLDLLAHPHLSSGLAEISATPPPTLQAPQAAPPPAKPPTAFQLFQEAHKPELEQQGLRGGKLLQELHRRWKQLQQEGGEELERLKLREAELRDAVQDSTLQGA